MELRPYQRDCIATIDAQPPGSYLVQMATGLGKCFAPGTEILMFDGTVKCVEDIKEGEQVMGADSSPRTVVGLAHGTETMYRVTPVKGDPYVVNESHILSLKMTNFSGSLTDGLGRKFRSRDICNITVRDYLHCSKTFKHCAKGWRTGVDYPEQPLPIPPYILGLWLGDGTASATSITTMEPEVVHEMHQYAVQNQMRVCVCDSSGAGKATTYSFVGKGRQHGCNTFRNALNTLGLFQNKHIPASYLINDRKQRMELLAGLLDTDGFLIDESVFEIVTCRELLGKQILSLARSLGFAAYCASKVVVGETYYRITISGDTSEIPVRVPRRQAKPRNQKKDVLVTGIKVEPVGLGDYYGFELQGKDRLFLLADFTVAHNTVTFANLPRHGERMLILSHREELVEQPRKYFDCTYGVERAGSHADGEEVVSASVQSLVRRLERFSPHDFGLIICDEAHHAAANTYRKIFEYFQPLKLVGFTATPNRGDKIRLSDVFQKIIFQRDLRWGIQNKYLCDILCKRVDIGYDLRAVHTRNGDYAPGELDEAMEGTADAIAQTYREHAAGATLIFAVSVHQAEEIAGRIKGAVVVTGETKDRAAIIEAFTAGEIPCIVNCMVFTEGTDIPRVETVIVARPTQSESLYCLDEQTEVLTESGWKTDVEIGEAVAAFNADTGEIEFVPAIAKVRRKLDADEYFCSIIGPSSDIRVTNKHRMIYDTKNRKGWKIRDAEKIADMRDGCIIPVSGERKFSGVPLTDDELTFIGWVMTDGSINPLNGQISITQGAHQPYIDEIENCIRGCGFKFTRSQYERKAKFNSSSDCIRWTISKGKPRGRDKHLTGWGKLEPWLSKDLSPALYDMTAEQFDVMLEAINHGDGHKNKWVSFHIGKGNKTFIERLQIMAIQRGYRASISIEKANAVRQSDLYILHIKKQGFIRIGSKYDGRPQWIKEPHTEESCWCVQNELGTLVTRRNGKVAIVGNCQMVGRGLRLYPGKERLVLIDCVGITGKASLCTAPSLLGLDLSNIPARKATEIQGDLFDLPLKIAAAGDCPESWIRNVEIVDLWAQEQKYNTHDINFFKMPDGEMVVSLTDGKSLTIPCPNSLGLVHMPDGSQVGMQEAIDRVYMELLRDYTDCRQLWDLESVRRWGKAPATDKQVAIIQRRCKGFDTAGLSKGDASQILNRLFNAPKKKGRQSA